MIALDEAVRRQQLVRRMLKRRTAQPADADAIAAVARAVYDDLARAAMTLIGRQGIHALAGRAWHLAQREQPGLIAAPEPQATDEPFARVVACLRRLAPAAAAEAAVTVLSILIGLLVTFIGEPLTARLLHQAWPDVSSGTTAEEK
jgi:hypothetical protein